MPDTLLARHILACRGAEATEAARLAVILVLSAIVFQTGRHYVKARNPCVSACCHMLSFPAFVSRCGREQLAWLLGVESVHDSKPFTDAGGSKCAKVVANRPQASSRARG